MPRIGPALWAGDGVELVEEAADDLIGVGGGAEMVELVENFVEGLFDVADGPFRVELALLFETALTLEELFPVEIRSGIEDRIAQRARVGQEARQTVP
jgi:hypothetical protein